MEYHTQGASFNANLSGDAFVSSSCVAAADPRAAYGGHFVTIVPPLYQAPVVPPFAIATMAPTVPALVQVPYGAFPGSVGPAAQLRHHAVVTIASPAVSLPGDTRQRSPAPDITVVKRTLDAVVASGAPSAVIAPILEDIAASFMRSGTTDVDAACAVASTIFADEASIAACANAIVHDDDPAVAVALEGRGFIDTDCCERRATFLCALMERASALGMQQEFTNIYAVAVGRVPALLTRQRGCVAVMRMLSLAAPSSSCTTSMIAALTACAATSVADPHAAYVYCHVISGFAPAPNGQTLSEEQRATLKFATQRRFDLVFDVCKWAQARDIGAIDRATCDPTTYASFVAALAAALVQQPHASMFRKELVLLAWLTVREAPLTLRMRILSHLSSPPPASEADTPAAQGPSMAVFRLMQSLTGRALVLVCVEAFLTALAEAPELIQQEHLDCMCAVKKCRASLPALSRPDETNPKQRAHINRTLTRLSATVDSLAHVLPESTSHPPAFGSRIN